MGEKAAGEGKGLRIRFARGFFTQPLFDLSVPASRRRGDIEVLIAQQRLNVAIVTQLHATRIAFYTAVFNNSLRKLGEAQRERLAQNCQHPGRALPGWPERSRRDDQREIA